MSLVRAKLLATGIHFALSAIVLGAIAVLLLQLWYPWPLWKMLDAPGMLMIAIGVDLVIGPLLTALVYKPGKRTLKLDLSVIVLLQVAALAFGVHTMAQARPVFVVAMPERIDVVAAFQFDSADLLAAPEWGALSWTGPRYVGTRIPNAAERAELMDLLGARDISSMPKFYVPFEQSWRLLSTYCDRSGDGRCKLLANTSRGFRLVVVDAQGRLVDLDESQVTHREPQQTALR
jgi:hypothetical protein